MSDDAGVLQSWFQWANRTDQWRYEFFEPKYTRVMLHPCEGMTVTHSAFPLAGVFGYARRDVPTAILLRVDAIKWAADTGVRYVVFVVNPVTRGIQVLEGAEVVARIKPQQFGDLSGVVTVDVSGLARQGVGEFFRAINSWQANWVTRRAQPAPLWQEVEPKGKP